MENQNKKTIIVAFKIGRGGRFNNGGQRSFIGDYRIDDSIFMDDLALKYRYQDSIEIPGDHQREIEYDGCKLTAAEAFIQMCSQQDTYSIRDILGINPDDLGELEYVDWNGDRVGLTLKQAETGIGRIDLDGDYETYYTKHIEDCDEGEIGVIEEGSSFVSSELKDFLKSFAENLENE
jgi:hypothetical protein